MKYKIGDKVKIKTWKDMEKEFGLRDKDYMNCGFANYMEEELEKLNTNRILTIKEIINNCCYHMEEVIFAWNDDMIEGREKMVKRENFGIAMDKNEAGIIDKDGELMGNFVVFDPETKMLKSIDENGNVINIIVYEIVEKTDENGKLYTHTAFNQKDVDNRWKIKLIKKEKEEEEEDNGEINSRTEILDL